MKQKTNFGLLFLGVLVWGISFAVGLATFNILLSQKTSLFDVSNTNLYIFTLSLIFQLITLYFLYRHIKSYVAKELHRDVNAKDVLAFIKPFQKIEFYFNKSETTEVIKEKYIVAEGSYTGPSLFRYNQLALNNPKSAIFFETSSAYYLDLRNKVFILQLLTIPLIYSVIGLFYYFNNNLSTFMIVFLFPIMLFVIFSSYFFPKTFILRFPKKDLSVHEENNKIHIEGVLKEPPFNSKFYDLFHINRNFTLDLKLLKK